MIRKAFFSVLDFLLFSNLFIACCALAQGLVTYFLLKLPPNHYVLAFLFCATLIIYNLSMLLAKPKAPQQSPFKRVQWVFSHQRLLISMTLIAMLCLIPLGLFFLSFQSQVFMCFVGLIALAYNVPFLTVNQKKIGLRNLPGVKLFLIGFVWSASCVIFPIIELQSTLGLPIALSEVMLLFAKRFLFICAITIPFDIRDLFQDRQYALKTIPVLWGEKKAWRFCLLLLAIYLMMLVLFNKAIDAQVIGLSITILLTGWLIFKSTLKRNEYYYFLFLDGTLILQGVVLWLCSLFAY